MDSFYTVKGNEVSKESIIAEFIENYTGNLTDFNEGSEIRNLLEAFAVYAMSLEERINDVLYVIDIYNADGEYLDLIAEQPGINMERIEGTEATGYVTFSIKTELTEELLIPEGTIVTSEDGFDFETETDNTILPGETSRDCKVRAIDVGTEGNIPANSILTKIDGYDAVDGFTVSNPQPFTGGVDYEEDDSFRERILGHMKLQKFGSKPYYKSMLAEEFPYAHDILFDTSSEDYTAVITPNTYGGENKQVQLEQDIMAYVSNENNVLLGHTFDVVSPEVKQITITVYDEGCFSDLEDNIKEIINTYITGGKLSFTVMEYPGLNLNVRLYGTDLIKAIRSVYPENDYSCELSVMITGGGVFEDGENKYEIHAINFDHSI